jgi:hypothetical protein
MPWVAMIGAINAWVGGRSLWGSWGSVVNHVMRLVVATAAAGWSGVLVLVGEGAGLARLFWLFS